MSVRFCLPLLPALALLSFGTAPAGEEAPANRMA